MGVPRVASDADWASLTSFGLLPSFVTGSRRWS
jgi:hypothetical protein